MHPKKAIHALLISLVGLTVSNSSFAGDSELETNSPFLPPNYNIAKPEPPKPVQQVNGPLSRELEFRGIVQLDGTYQFSLFHKTENRGYWIPENGTENGLSVRNFNLNSMTITVTLNGRTEMLTLMTATDTPMPVAVSSPQATVEAPEIPGMTNGETTNTTPRRVIPRRRVVLPKR